MKGMSPDSSAHNNWTPYTGIIWKKGVLSWVASMTQEREQENLLFILLFNLKTTACNSEKGSIWSSLGERYFLPPARHTSHLKALLRNFFLLLESYDFPGSLRTESAWWFDESVRVHINQAGICFSFCWKWFITQTCEFQGKVSSKSRTDTYISEE